jgi:hypothetical protein
VTLGRAGFAATGPVSKKFLVPLFLKSGFFLAFGVPGLIRSGI